jgi:hypothetical protein
MKDQVRRQVVYYRLQTKTEESTRLVYTGFLGELEHLKIKTSIKLQSQCESGQVLFRVVSRVEDKTCKCVSVR